ncbi:MAG: SRPBCC family protein [Pirellulales bacterium]|nr:SRPBCC family protein [Pirellulales bacterium]
MARFTIKKHFEAPHELVFELASDLEHAADNIRSIERLEVLTPGAVGVGTRFRETRVMFGKRSTEEMEVTAFEPTHGYTVECESCGGYFRAEYKFVGDISGTHVQLDFDTWPVSFMAKLFYPLSILMLGPMKKMVEADLEDLKTIAENRAKRLAHQV